MLNKDLLEIRDGNSRIQTTAEHVYSSVIEENPAWDDLQPGKSGEAS